MILLDTNALIWFAEDSSRLGAKARRMLIFGLARGQLAISVISLWEMAMLVIRDRIKSAEPIDLIRRRIAEQGIREIDIDGSIAIAAARFVSSHGDPIDRLIMATAAESQATLLTADDRILDWRGPLKTIDARR